ncbi:hypothetical protein [Pseudonocardia xishanensis]|uniref:Universal stress protein family protein n=1 Tax=Pseudonocardia xishanensis TaxID=630995 RepID=A0ABP8RTR3_9PSEU
MSGGRGPVVLATAHDTAVSWAVAEAAGRGLALRVAGRDELARARTVRTLRLLAPGVPVSAVRLADPLGVDLPALTASAHVLVVDAPARADVVAAAGCAVVAVPASATPPGRVVVGVTARDAPAVLPRAVEEALARDAELVVVGTWTGRAPVPPTRRWADGAAAAHRELVEATAGCRATHPDLRLRLFVVHDDAESVLTPLTAEAELLVVGGVRPPPNARCPVLVVPPAGERTGVA